ncbi:MAG: beta-propeller domain-containing protein [Oscillospiraceae bacterium]|nr:beta-propeller domain-containing protein [Oscillospiraceae bacterium]
MKTFDERTNEVLWKIHTEKRKRKNSRKVAVLMVSLCLVITAAVVLFLPFEWMAPSVSAYKDDAYYPLIKNLCKIGYLQDKGIDYGGPRNIFEYIIAKQNEPVEQLLFQESAGTNGSGYVEVTDNQVQGVIEGDLFKRTEQHIFYLQEDANETVLRVYTIAGSESRWLTTYRLRVDFSHVSKMEMYLSEDGTIATVILAGNRQKTGEQKEVEMVCVVTLDVSRPKWIRELGCQYITGEYGTSRKVDDVILLVSKMYISTWKLDLDDRDTYLPKIGQLENMEHLEPDAILNQKYPCHTYLTTILLVQEGDGKILDTAAYLASSSNNFYVTEDMMFIPVAFTENRGYGKVKRMTEILCISFADQRLEQLGSAVVDGVVKDQYSMDVYDGTLRVVTTTHELTYDIWVDENVYHGGEWVYWELRSWKYNANLYCISTDDWSVKGKVESFAPEGERVESARFDGNTAYVCTAEVIILTDPVYFFDLSDPANITWKDTGTIDGYSSSLVDFGACLLGIGYGETRALKVEVYREAENSVESVCIYDGPNEFATNYKAYLIDRENGYVGIPVREKMETEAQLLLLQFDGEKLNVVERIETKGYLNDIRSVIIDGWLYTIGDTFFVIELE